jgi:3-hydroxy-D-aspartate aldolase
VDHPQAVADLASAARASGAQIEVLVEIDVGTRRCGIAPGAPALELARAVVRHAYLRFAGIQAYHGIAQHQRAAADRRAFSAQAVELARSTRDLLERAGLRCQTVTGARTGTFPFEQGSGVYTELQPGSYVFMDADYSRNDWTGFPAFEQSLHVWTTVMSAPAADRVVVDAGMKAQSIDSGMPGVAGFAGVTYARASDEHGVLSVAEGASAPKLGDRLRLVPGHCDPTVNLHDWFVCVRGDRVESLWPVTARGAFY